MTKKKGRLQLLFMGLFVFAALLWVVPAHPVSASGPVTTAVDEDHPAAAGATKKLVMPEGTSTPTASFTITFAKVSKNGSTDAGDLATMPAIADKVLTFAVGDTGTTTGNIKTVIMETGDVLGVTWPHAGIYVYTVAETSGTYTISNAYNEQMTYSGGSYTMTVYVENKSTSGVYVKYVMTKIAALETGDTRAVGDKVDSKPGGDGSTYTHSQMYFTNTYLKTTGSDDPKHANVPLVISKAVAGGLADQTKYFPFSVTVAQPPVGTGLMTYKVRVLNGTTVVTSAAHFSGTIIPDATNGAYFEITPGTAAAVNLKHGERIAIVGLPVGASYTVTEAADTVYTPSQVSVINGATQSSVGGTINTLFTVGPRLIAEGADSVAFKNTLASTTPTGISVDNLPYVVLLGIILAGFALFIVVKSRRRAY